MNTKATLWKNSLTYGAIAGLILVIYSLALYILDLTFYHPILLGQMVSSVLAIVLMMLGTKNLRDKFFNGSITYGIAFLSAFLIGLIAMFISLIFSDLLNYVIDPGLQAKGLEYQADKWLSSGRFTQDQIDSMMEKQKEMMTKPWVMVIGQVFAVIMMAIISAVLALITAAIQKKEGGFDAAMADVEETK